MVFEQTVDVLKQVVKAYRKALPENSRFIFTAGAQLSQPAINLTNEQVEERLDSVAAMLSTFPGDARVKLNLEIAIQAPQQEQFAVALQQGLKAIEEAITKESQKKMLAEAAERVEEAKKAESEQG
jgi:hypothetical protein